MSTSDATLVIDDAISRQLAKLAADPLERAGVLIVGVGDHGGALRLIARGLWQPPADAYLSRERDGLQLSSSGWAPALALAGEMGAAALFVHTHPGGIPVPSDHDALVDAALAEPFSIRTGRDTYGSVVLAHDEGPLGFSFTGLVEHAGQLLVIGRLLQVGRRIRLSLSYGGTAQALPTIYDRQVRAFGGGVQQLLAELQVGVAGAGGTGSAVLEQLVRLGVRHVYLADPDVLTASNVTRVYGSTPADVGRHKVDIQRDHLLAIAPDLQLTTATAGTTSLLVAHALSGCDVVFGCTDDETGRIMLSRLASAYLAPLIDCGVLLSSDDGRLLGIDSRVTTVISGTACLLCRDRVDLARAAAEQMSAAELQERQREGYAPELAGIEPAVVSFTSLTAALAVAELLERLTGFGVDPAPSEVLARIHDRELSTNSRSPREGHFCHHDSPDFGVGDQEPFLRWWAWQESL